LGTLIKHPHYDAVETLTGAETGARVKRQPQLVELLLLVNLFQDETGGKSPPFEGLLQSRGDFIR